MFPVPAYQSQLICRHETKAIDSPFSNSFGLIYPSGEADATWAKDIETSIAAINPSKISNRGQYVASHQYLPIHSSCCGRRETEKEIEHTSNLDYFLHQAIL